MARRLSALLAVGALVLLALVLPAPPAARAQGPTTLVLNVTLWDNTSQPLVGPWNAKVVVPSLTYASSINANFTNVEFAYPNGTFVPSWVEANASNASSTTVVWLRFNVTLAAHATTTVRMDVFAKTAYVLSSLGPMGEAPTLGGTYAAWDDGPMVFPFYDNFRGTTLNGADWVSSFASGAAVVSSGLTSTSAQTGGAAQASCGVVGKTQNLTGRGYVEDLYGQAGTGSRTGPFTSSNSANTCASTANTVVQALDPAPATLTQYTVFSQSSAGTYATNTVSFTWKQTANYLWSLQSLNNSTGAKTFVNYTSAVGGPTTNLSETTVYPGIWMKASSGSIGPWYWVRERPALPLGKMPVENITVWVNPATVPLTTGYPWVLLLGGALGLGLGLLATGSVVHAVVRRGKGSR